MRIKIGDTWYSPSAEAAIMLELSDADKANIAGMAASATRYAQFDDGDPRTSDQKVAWMDDRGISPMQQQPPRLPPIITW